MSQKVKVCVRAIPDTLSRGIHRVATALARYAPDWAEIVSDPKEADLWILHVIGHGSIPKEGIDRPYAIVQYCLLTTEDSRPEAWLSRWWQAKAVWSYYDLIDYCAQRQSELIQGTRFYYAPLGVDGSVFKPNEPIRKRFLIGTSGYVAETEGVRECYNAVQKLKGSQFHLGPNLNLGPGVVSAMNIDDETVAECWSQCSFVAGLRRIEGFELPVLEALASGSRPIVFDAPHYRQWFGEHAEYIPEVGADEVVDALVEVMSKPVRPVTAVERSHVLATFDWQTLAQGYWEALR